MAWVTSTVIAVIGVVAALASAGVGTAAALSSADAQKKASKFNEAVQRNNAMAAQEQAAFEAAKLRRRNNALAGAQAAAIGKAGIDFSGSASDVVYDSAVQGELDALAALYTGRVRSNSEEAGASLARSQGDNATTSGYYGAAGSILGGVGSATGSYGGYLSRKT